MTVDEIASEMVQLLDAKAVIERRDELLLKEMEALSEQDALELSGRIKSMSTALMALSQSARFDYLKRLLGAILSVPHPTSNTLVRIENKESRRPRLQVLVLAEAFVVDIIPSLENDPRNIGHPLIVWAIQKYVHACEVQAKRSSRLPEEKVARDVLENIYKALIVGAEQRREGALARLRRIQGSWPDDYFDAVWLTMQDSTVKRLSNVDNHETRSRYILEQLSARLPDIDHTAMLEFLEYGNAPKRGGANALRNQFLAWRNGTSVKTIRNQLSSVRGEIRRIFPEGLEGAADCDDSRLESQFMAFHFGRGIVSNADEVRRSNLAWKEDTNHKV